MALNTWHRVLAATAILLLFGCGLYALKSDTQDNTTVGLLSIAGAICAAGALIRANYKQHVSNGRE